jgi:hypothetical protein
MVLLYEPAGWVPLTDKRYTIREVSALTGVEVEIGV